MNTISKFFLCIAAGATLGLSATRPVSASTENAACGPGCQANCEARYQACLATKDCFTCGEQYHSCISKGSAPGLDAD